MPPKAKKYPSWCPECGGPIGLSQTPRLLEYRGILLPSPPGLKIPTCSRCGESYLDGHLTSKVCRYQDRLYRERLAAIVDLKVLVCGGRSFGSTPQEQALFRETMAGVGRGARCIVHGGGASGADALAAAWAKERGKRCVQYKSNWASGRSGSARHNAEMLRAGQPDLVIAFPGDESTQDMIRQALAAGIYTWRA